MSSFDEKKLGQLRPMTDNDLEMVLEWRNASGVRKNMYTQQVISLAEHRNWWARTKDRNADKYLIFEANGAPTGLVAFNNIEPAHETSDWAFYASQNASPGMGSRMEFLALDYAFNQLLLNKLCCEVLAFNSGVLSLHNKFGFREEGLFKSQKKYEGVFVDILRLAIFAPEWSRKRPQLLERIIRRL